MSLISDRRFYCRNKDVYPPFKNGLYLEEYFMKYVHSQPPTNRKYIPALWTNFQIECWFQSNKLEMQRSLDTWVSNNPSKGGYFAVVQYDDGPLLNLPKDTIVYGACCGDVPIPLIYQDVTNRLTTLHKKSFKEKTIFCSFVGSLTYNGKDDLDVRKIMSKTLSNKVFDMIYSDGWTPDISTKLQNLFLQRMVDSKFALAPRGYGRASFRFYECLQLGTIPVYLWNDVKWLPFNDIINYDKLCICLNISDINTLETILKHIDEKTYNEMLSYYDEIKYLFEMKGMSSAILSSLKS